MKVFRAGLVILIAFYFTGCFSIPGYVSNNGSITPPYSKEICIETLSGELSVTPMETSKGIMNKDPAKSDPLKYRKQNTIFLSESTTYYYDLEGNHSIVLAFRTLSKEAVFRITYKGVASEVTIHNSDLGDKLIYLENY